MPSPLKAVKCRADLSGYLRRYKQQPELTPRLDGLGQTKFTQATINEIVLWKVNRYAFLTPAILRGLETLRRIKRGQHRRAESVLIDLVAVHGVDLAMASTILRFRNPDAFQILDRRAYRALYGVEYPLHTKCSASRKVEAYFQYLEDLRDLCKQRGLNFRMVDRILYEFDKDKNGNLKN